MPALRELLRRRAPARMNAVVRTGTTSTWNSSWSYGRTINSVLANPTGFRCIETIVNNVSRPSFEVREPNTDKPILNHPLLTVLNRPDTGSSATTFQRQAARDLELAGKSVWVKVRGRDGYGDAGPLTGLKHLPIDRVAVLGSEEDELLGFVYRNRAGQSYPFLPADILYLHHPHPERSFDGIAPALIAGLGAETDTASSRFNFDLLANDGALPGYLTVEGLSPEQFTEWKAAWESTENPGKTRFLTGTASYHRVGQSNEELTYAALRTASQSDIYKAFGCPKVLIEPEGATFANVRQAKAAFWQMTVAPKLVLLADDLTTQLGNEEGVEIGFDLSSIEEIHEGLASLVERSVPLLDRGVLTPNEVRLDMGLAPVPWGDEPVNAPEPPQSLPAGPETVLPEEDTAFPPQKALEAPSDEATRMAAFHQRQGAVIAARIRAMQGKAIAKAVAPEQWWDQKRWDSDLSLVTTKGEGINEATRAELGSLVDGAANEGLSADEIAERVQHYFDQKAVQP